MKKVVLIAYNGELMCFAHVMLYALDLSSKGFEVNVVIEGSATGLISQLNKPGTPFANVYTKLREQNLITCICQACSQKMGTIEDAKSQGLNIVGDMQGHPSIDLYLRDEWEVLTF